MYNLINVRPGRLYSVIIKLIGFLYIYSCLYFTSFSVLENNTVYEPKKFKTLSSDES
jgi:hypothetical protein